MADRPKPNPGSYPRDDISDDVLEAIVVDGDATYLVSFAKAIGEGLHSARLTTNQLRNVFTTIRQIEMNWPIVGHEQAAEDEATRQRRHRAQQRARSAARQLLLLRPKLAYQASREQKGGTGMRFLSDTLAPAIDLVGENRAYFQNLVDFLEAIVAYHASAN